MDDWVGGRCAQGGEEDDGDSRLRAVPVEAARVSNSSNRKPRKREEADAAGAGAAKKKKPHSVCPRKRKEGFVFKIW